MAGLCGSALELLCLLLGECCVPGVVVAGLCGVKWLYQELLWLLLGEWLYTWSCCGWPVWGKVAVPGIIVAAAGVVVVYLELFWLACVG